MSDLVIRPAAEADLPAIVALLAEDVLGRERDDPSLPLGDGYVRAFAEIQRRPDQHLMVGELGGEVVATLQLTFVPGLARKGAWRGIVEAVHVRGDRRSRGLGGRMIAWAAETARARGDCPFLQLTTDKRRLDAHRFYEREGFRRSHEGYKLLL
ncbi:MAG TPA: GNAT family N-acetyltransferase [Caulobacteraceae bacterium]|jgi:GNAT superfamily N-acetyltransferase